MKNFYFVKKFQDYYRKVYVVSFKRSGFERLIFPFKVLKVLLLSLLNPNAKIVLSSTAWEVNPIVKALGVLGLAKRGYYWVPGGVFHIVVKEKYEKALYMKLNRLFVQSPSMVNELGKMGFSNVVYVPNSKKIFYYPEDNHKQNGIIKFVFLSRIHPAKGCDMIIDCVKRLNELGYEKKFMVDFYGNIDHGYRNVFLEQCNNVTNVSYKGYLDLTIKEGYDTLSTYDMMLFPSYWWGEGFPGVVIDAYICGLPIIASDWNFNCDVIDHTTGIIVHTKKTEELCMEMKNTLDGKYDLISMSRNCKQKTHQYDNDQVLSESNLRQLGLL